jgi:hypothetical protein
MDSMSILTPDGKPAKVLSRQHKQLMIKFPDAYPVPEGYTRTNKTIRPSQ